ncbi:MAG: energy transducer TonB [Saprospiraceae bacterium]
MAHEINYAQQVEEALFHFKNKAYGAWQIRRKRERNLFVGILGGVLGLGFLYLSPLLLIFLKKVKNAELSETGIEVAITPYSQLMAPPPIPEEPKPKDPVLAPPQVSTVKFVKPVVKADDEAPDEELPTMKDLAKANPGRITQQGSDDIYADYAQQKVVPDQPKQQEAPPPPPPKPKPAPEEIYDYVSKKPEYPGGEEALLAYVGQNINYPSIAREARIEGMVVIRFVVDREGGVRDVEILKDIGGGCGSEAVRVVKTLGRWTPGEQNGKPVSVRYVLPIRFKLKEAQ